MVDSQKQLSLTDFSLLLDKMRGSNNKEVGKLNKNLDSLNKKILSLAKIAVPGLGLASTVTSIAQNRKQYSSFGESLREKFVNPLKKFSTIRGSLDSVGLVKKDAGGVIDKLLEKREAKKEFIDQQFLVNPQMKRTKENSKAFGNKFEKQQTVQKELGKIESKIEKLKAAGFSDAQIERSGLTKKREDKAAELIASDNRLYDLAKKTKEEKPAEKVEKKASKESENESVRLTQLSLNTQERMADDIAAIKEILSRKDEAPVAEQKQENSGSWFKNILLGLASGIGGFLLPKIKGFLSFAKTGLSKMVEPVKKIFTGAKNAATQAISKGKTLVKSAASKAGGMVRGALPKVLSTGVKAARIATGPIGVAAQALAFSNDAGAGSDIVPEGTKPFNFEGAKPLDEKVVATKPAKSVTMTEVVAKTNEKNAALKETSKQQVNSNTVVSAPTTNNNVNNQNNFMKFGPRNPEHSQQRIKSDKFMR